MAKYVNRESLIQSMTMQLGLSYKDAGEAVDLVFNEIASSLADGGVTEIPGFGKFQLFHRKERMGINPATQERMEIASSEVPKFRPSQTLKNKCNQKN